MISFLGTSLLLTLAQAAGPLPTLEVRPSAANVSLGERFQVTVEARGGNGTSYQFPQEVSTGSVELIRSSKSPGLAEVATYDVQVFALGADAQIPEIEVRYTQADGATGSIKSAPVSLNIVRTLDPSDANPAPADYAPPVPVLVSRAFWIASGLAGALMVAVLVALARRLRFPKKRRDASVTPAASPEEEALAGLEALAGSRPTIEPKTFYIRLVQILKLYLERRLQAPVLEMTSTEALGFVKAHAWTAPHAAGLRDLVTSADLVKFGGSSDASNADRQIQFVRDLVSRVDRLRRAELEKQARDQDQRKTA